MLFFFRMLISILFGVTSVFLLLWAIELHVEVNARAEHLRQRAAQNDESNAHEVADAYSRSMQPKLGFRYGIAGLFLVCASAALAIDDRRDKDELRGMQVFEPEEK